MALRDLITLGLGPEIVVAGAGDWTDAEKAQIRYRLQLDGVQTPPADTDLPAVNVTHLKGTALTETAAGRLAAALSKLLDVASPVLTAASVNQSGDAFGRLGAPAGASVSADIAAIFEDTGTTLPALINTRSTLGSGAIPFTYTLTSSVDGSAIADADVWVTSDMGGSSLLASGRTNAIGQVTFHLDAGTVYVWRQKSGWNFFNPDTETVS